MAAIKGHVARGSDIRQINKCHRAGGGLAGDSDSLPDKPALIIHRADDPDHFSGRDVLPRQPLLISPNNPGLVRHVDYQIGLCSLAELNRKCSCSWVDGSHKSFERIVDGKGPSRTVSPNKCERLFLK